MDVHLSIDGHLQLLHSLRTSIAMPPLGYYAIRELAYFIFSGCNLVTANFSFAFQPLTLKKTRHNAWIRRPVDLTLTMREGKFFKFTNPFRNFDPFV